MSDEFRMQYFGARWNVAMLEGAERVDTPIGEECVHCEETIRLGDQGLIRPYITASGTRPAAIHRECDLRMAIGGVNHLEGRCTCHGGDQPPDPPGLTRREAARKAYEWSAAHGGAR